MRAQAPLSRAPGEHPRRASAAAGRQWQALFKAAPQRSWGGGSLVSKRRDLGVAPVGIVDEAQLTAVHLRRQVREIDRDRRRQEHVLLGIAGGRFGFAAEQPPAEPFGILKADAAVAEIPIVLRE